MTDQPDDPLHDPGDDASLDLPALPRLMLISEPGLGHLDVGHTGDLCWRIAYDDTGPIRQAVADVLARCGMHLHIGELGHWDESLDMPKLPQHLVIRQTTDGALFIGRAGDAEYPISAGNTGPLRQAIAAALHTRTHQPRPDYERAPTKVQ